MQQGDKIEMEPLLLRLQVVIYLIPQVWKTCNHCSAKTSDDEGKKNKTMETAGSIGGTIKTMENYLILARNLA